jgi:hypothetical protein
VRQLFASESRKARYTPVEAAVYGAAAGLAATILLSALARVLPGMDMDPKSGDKRGGGLPPPPEDPFNPRQVGDWQARSQSPAAYRPPPAAAGAEQRTGPPAATPAGALTRPRSPGPEGLAEQFAFKVGSGLFDRDTAPAIRPLGLATHLAYGTVWGVLYGLLQGSYRCPALLFGSLYGLVVWAVGPATLVPAMKLMRPIPQEPPVRSAVMVAGHIAYGIALAGTFEQMGSGRKR